MGQVTVYEEYHVHKQGTDEPEVYSNYEEMLEDIQGESGMVLVEKHVITKSILEVFGIVGKTIPVKEKKLKFTEKSKVIKYRTGVLVHDGT